VVRITLDGPGLNAVDRDVHRELADGWLAVDRDEDTNVALLRGAGKAFSAGGSFELLDEMIEDYEARTRVLREARDLVFDAGPDLVGVENEGVGPPALGPRAHDKTCLIIEDVAARALRKAAERGLEVVLEDRCERGLDVRGRVNVSRAEHVRPPLAEQLVRVAARVVVARGPGHSAEPAYLIFIEIRIARIPTEPT
jgi:hypothetical protein